MRIIGVTSSPKKNGNTATLLREVLRGAEQKGAETEEIYLPDYDIKFCKGCDLCMSKGICPLDDDFAILKEKFNNADGIILGSPNYAFSPNAMMKRFIERFGMLEYMTSSVFGGKYIVTLATTGGQGAKKVAKYLAAIPKDGVFQRAYITNILTASNTVNVPVSENEKVLEEAYQTGQKMASDIRSNRTYPFQNIIRRIINKLILKPKFTKIVQSKKDKDLKAVYENLVNRNLITAN
jgi:multimeric flavodoxin WrbA